jgi:hypothetical protein
MMIKKIENEKTKPKRPLKKITAHYNFWNGDAGVLNFFEEMGSCVGNWDGD